MTEKEILRKHIREQKRQFSNEELIELSLPIVNRMLSHPAVVSAKTILLYYSLPDEVFTHDVIRQIANTGKKVLLPRVIDNENMELREYRDDNDLEKGSFNIMEPKGAIFSDYENIDVAIIPGMAFDLSGNRMGRGRGYYDRLLAKAGNMYKIGMCFDFQKTDYIPTDSNDVKMDCVL